MAKTKGVLDRDSWEDEFRRREGQTYACHVYDRVHIFNGLVKHPYMFKVTDLNKIQLRYKIRTCIKHIYSLCHRTSCPSNFQPPAEKYVNNMCPNKPRGACDEDVAA